MEFNYLSLIITCFLYGFSTNIRHWEGFRFKLTNVLVLIALLVLTIIAGEDAIISKVFDTDTWTYTTNIWYWLNYILPAGALAIGTWIGKLVIEKTKDADEWRRVIMILAELGLLVTIVAICFG